MLQAVASALCFFCEILMAVVLFPSSGVIPVPACVPTTSAIGGSATGCRVAQEGVSVCLFSPFRHSPREILWSRCGCSISPLQSYFWCLWLPGSDPISRVSITYFLLFYFTRTFQRAFSFTVLNFGCEVSRPLAKS